MSSLLQSWKTIWMKARVIVSLTYCRIEEQMSAVLFWAEVNATFWKIHRSWIPPLWMELLFLSRCAYAVCSDMQHIWAMKLIVNGCVCNWITALFSHCDRSSIMTNNCQRGTMSLMTEGGEKEARNVIMMNLIVFQRARKQQPLFSPLVQKQCQS